MEEDYKTYNLYRGLQKPFSLFGLKGINVIYGGVAIGGGMALFVIGYFIGGFIFGLAAALLVIVYCGFKIHFHMNNGLHMKDKYEGVWIVKHLIRPTFSGNVEGGKQQVNQ